MPRRFNEAFVAGRWSLPLLFSFSLALVVVTNGIAQAKSFQKQSAGLPVGSRLEAEQRLSDLGYWTGTIDGNFDSSSRHALIAFQKVEGRKRSGILTAHELEALRHAERPRPRFNGYYHIEVDLTRQVLFIVSAENVVSNILPICTGNDKQYFEKGQRGLAHTPRGKFKVLRKLNGWRRSPLGLLYYPSYFHEGFAIHGSSAVLTYPASHGCIRIPIFASKRFSEIAAVGTEVFIYDS